MTQLVVPYFSEYGAPELKESYQKYLLRALIIAALIHLTLVGSYWASVKLHKEEPPVRIIKIMKYSELGPPPSIQGAEAAMAPAVSVAEAIAKPSVGIPVPVPDAEVNPEQTFATQQELSATTGPVGDAAGAGGNAVIEQDITIEDDNAPPPDFVAFSQEPVVIKRVEPEYPPLAQKAGLSGRVIAHIWIDKNGKVREVKIIKSDSEIFNQAVIDAAKQWQFTPAMMKNGPVAVWFAVPFFFKLKN
jgi:periplasmic protein TonB